MHYGSFRQIYWIFFKKTTSFWRTMLPKMILFSVPVPDIQLVYELRQHDLANIVISWPTRYLRGCNINIYFYILCFIAVFSTFICLEVKLPVPRAMLSERSKMIVFFNVLLTCLQYLPCQSFLEGPDKICL